MSPRRRTKRQPDDGGRDHLYDDMSLWVFYELVLPLLLISGVWCFVLLFMTGSINDLNHAGFNDLGPFGGLLVFGTYVKIEGVLRHAKGKRCCVNNSLSHFTLIAAIGLMALCVVMSLMGQSALSIQMNI